MEEQKHLTDESVFPTDDVIFHIIGEHAETWKQTSAYLNEKDSNISRVWKYYKDGKSWMQRTLQKKNTVCWIIILNNTFRIAFYFAERLEQFIMDSQLSEALKEQYRKAKAFNKSRAIYIDVKEPGDIENIRILIDLKLESYGSKLSR